MTPGGTGRSALRRTIASLLESGDPGKAMSEIRKVPIRRAVAALMSLLSTPHPAVRERAAALLGVQVSELADEHIESGREVMRRLMWSLNEESGSSGWGAPQAMAEIMAHHQGLAEEYARILVSYMRQDGNFLEHLPLQRDLLRGVCVLAGARPRILRDLGARRLLHGYLESEDADVRRLAQTAIGILDG